ncbi:acetyltransferase [Aspergillus eucalypticola CBS 122712]|uniref:Acetyltransferase n=3 Tax=Aspergillus eucalypticola (strain CBS 122712 / IBT 29274) TaxID=1448314 RepID=A0A317UPM7_ASPEC|nr:acetyltransferase [Aspergillus eucalypticola CBS 122712]PWY62392.1 acetyltransferase [Aspergillus eucalypticola CBS 122712]
MSDGPGLLALSPLDHIPAKLFLPYILYFDTTDTQTALSTLQKGIDRLISELPWLAGDVVLYSVPDGPKNRMHIAPPRVPLSDVPMLKTKHFDGDADSHSHPIQSYLPLPTFIPASQQRPVLRFQANVFHSRIIVAMSFWHSVFDGTGAGVILEAVAECCKSTNEEITTSLAQTIAKTHDDLRKEVAKFPSKCVKRLDHSIELGTPVFDPNISTEQWNAMESALSSMVETKRYTFSSEKVAKVKDICTQLMPQLQSSKWISSNDVITATLAICVDRALHPERADRTQSADFLMAVDLRSRVDPPLPETYLGNAIFPVHDDIYSEEMAGQTGNDADTLHLAQLALRIRMKLTTMDKTLMYSASAAVADYEDWTKVEAGPAGIIVTSWRGLKVFSLDFGAGLGHIVDFEPGLTLVPGGCIFLPSRTSLEKSGSSSMWEVCITLKAGDSQLLEKDPLFNRILA